LRLTSSVFFKDPSSLGNFIARKAPETGEYNVCLVGAGENPKTSREISIAVNRKKPNAKVTVIETDEYPQSASRRQNLVLNRMEELSEVPTSSQHLAIAAYVHNYTEDKLRALMEVHRILAPGGAALVNINPNTPISFSRPVRAMVKRQRKPGVLKREVVFMRLQDVLDYLRVQGHKITVLGKATKNSVPLLIEKNKPGIGIKSRLISTPRWNEKALKWDSGTPEAEAQAHYSTNQKTIRRLAEFMDGRVKPVAPV
jgi:hypothetical protein